MSNHSAKPKLKAKTYFGFRKDSLASLIFAFIFSAGVVVFFLHDRNSRLDWPSTDAVIKETRLVVVSRVDTKSHQTIYQVQAYALYKRDGRQYEEWLPVDEESSDRVFLEFWLSQKKSKTGIVRWAPKNPSYLEAVLY